eukprot:TRINITY_DN30521_c0_g1_i1.p1 TRINITY_DN30521_c0_g1~~TRINITY_DN30521_c0_g1_i1.p1  ORF type:complete len:435 (+),score=46.07 TRINITY_DN30521_c0_g1_i1:39-1343(+)
MSRSPSFSRKSSDASSPPWTMSPGRSEKSGVSSATMSPTRSESPFPYQVSKEDIVDLNEKLLKKGSSIRMLSRHHSAGRSWHKAEIRTLLLRPKEREIAERAKMWKITLLAWKHFQAMTLPYRRSEAFRRKLYIKRLFREKVYEALHQKRTEAELRRNAVLRGFIERYRTTKRTASIAIIQNYLQREKAWNKLRYCCQTYHSAVQILTRTLYKHSRLRRRQRNKALKTIEEELLPSFKENHYALTGTKVAHTDKVVYRRFVSDKLSANHWKYSNALSQFHENEKNGESTFGEPPYYFMFLREAELKSIILFTHKITTLEKTSEPSSRGSIQLEEQTIRRENITSVHMATIISAERKEEIAQLKRMTPSKIMRKHKRLTPTPNRLSPVKSPPSTRKLRTPTSRTPTSSSSPTSRKLLSPIPMGRLSPPHTKPRQP